MLKKEPAFQMKDDSFRCEICNKNVEKLNYTARDHCPFCLYSKHVDINPGDRLEKCQGTMMPIAIEKFKTDQYKIVYHCQTCGKIHKNIAATDDNMDEIIRIMSEPQTF